MTTIPYTLVPTAIVLRDEPRNQYRTNAAFHLKHGDYLLYLATIIGLMEEALMKCGTVSKKDIAFISTVRADLQDINTNYTLTEKK